MSNFCVKIPNLKNSINDEEKLVRELVSLEKEILGIGYEDEERVDFINRLVDFYAENQK